MPAVNPRVYYRADLEQLLDMDDQERDAKIAELHAKLNAVGNLDTLERMLEIAHQAEEKLFNWLQAKDPRGEESPLLPQTVHACLRAMTAGYLLAYDHAHSMLRAIEKT